MAVSINFQIQTHGAKSERSDVYCSVCCDTQALILDTGAGREMLCLVPGSGEVALNFSVRRFLIAARVYGGKRGNLLHDKNKVN